MHIFFSRQYRFDSLVMRPQIQHNFRNRIGIHLDFEKKVSSKKIKIEIDFAFAFEPLVFSVAHRHTFDGTQADSASPTAIDVIVLTVHTYEQARKSTHSHGFNETERKFHSPPYW